MMWNSNHVAFLKSNYNRYSRKELCAAFNAHFGLEVSVHQLTSTLKRNKINSGRSGHFEKGYTPWHAGTKGVKGPTSGTFTKGVSFPTHRTPGDEVVKNGILYVKGDNGKYIPKQNILWSQFHRRPMPEGFKVIFVDGDRKNFAKENLLLVSRSQLGAIVRRGLAKQTGELAIAEKLVAAIEFYK